MDQAFATPIFTLQLLLFHARKVQRIQVKVNRFSVFLKWKVIHFFSVLLQILIDLSATCILYIVAYTANIYRDITVIDKTRNCHWES